MVKETKRININVPLEFLAKIDDYADSMCVNRTSAILFLVNQAFEYKTAVEMLPQMMGAIGDLKGLEKSVKK